MIHKVLFGFGTPQEQRLSPSQHRGGLTPPLCASSVVRSPVRATAAEAEGPPPRRNSEPSRLAGCETDPVRTILNLIWLVLSAFWLALAYAFSLE